MVKNAFSLMDTKIVENEESFIDSIEFRVGYIKYPSFSNEYQQVGYF
jgi:hypothetical protein